MKRVTLRSEYKTPEGNFQPGAVVPMEDVKAEELIRLGKGKLAPDQVVYTHQDEMSEKVREKALAALEAADAAGGINAVAARAAATAPFRKEKA